MRIMRMQSHTHKVIDVWFGMRLAVEQSSTVLRGVSAMAQLLDRKP